MLALHAADNSQTQKVSFASETAVLMLILDAARAVNSSSAANASPRTIAATSTRPVSPAA